MKVPIKAYKAFKHKTALNFGHFCALQVAANDKAGTSLLLETDSLLDDLEDEGLVERHLDTVSGKVFVRISLTEFGKLFLNDSEFKAEVQEVFEHFATCRALHLPNTRKIKLNSTDKGRIEYWLKQGKTVDDFKKVHNYFFKDWKGSKYEKNLTMQTLYKRGSNSTFEDKLRMAQENYQAKASDHSNFKLK